MPQNLITDLTITLGAGASITSSHLLVDADGTGLIPFEVRPDRVTSIVATNATTTQVTFTNEGAGTETAIFRCWRYVSNVAPDNTTALLWTGGFGGGSSMRFDDDIPLWFGTDNDLKAVYDTTGKPYFGLVGTDAASNAVVPASVYFFGGDGGDGGGGAAGSPGGTIYAEGGAGGNATAGSTSNDASEGGSVDLQGGTGGAAFAGIGNGGVGGDATMYAGDGGDGAVGQTGGTGGEVVISAGAGGDANGGTQGAGGDLSLYAGGGLTFGWINIGTATTRGVKVGVNLLIGASAAGTDGTLGLVLSNAAVAPTTSTDIVTLYAVDLSAANATLGIRTETAVVTESVVSNRTLSIVVNGVTYKLCLFV